MARLSPSQLISRAKLLVDIFLVDAVNLAWKNQDFGRYFESQAGV